jgi:hypothetical protein
MFLELSCQVDPLIADRPPSPPWLPFVFGPHLQLEPSPGLPPVLTHSFSPPLVSRQHLGPDLFSCPMSSSAVPGRLRVQGSTTSVFSSASQFIIPSLQVSYQPTNSVLPLLSRSTFPPNRRQRAGSDPLTSPLQEPASHAPPQLQSKESQAMKKIVRLSAALPRPLHASFGLRASPSIPLPRSH